MNRKDFIRNLAVAALAPAVVTKALADEPAYGYLHFGNQRWKITDVKLAQTNVHRPMSYKTSWSTEYLTWDSRYSKALEPLVAELAEQRHQEIMKVVRLSSYFVS